MAKGDSNKSIGKVKSATETRAVKETRAVSEVVSVKATTAVGGVKGAGSISGKRGPTKVMTAEEREQLLLMVEEEAQKMVARGILPKGKRELIESAVKMAIDSGIPEASDESASKNSQKRPGPGGGR